MKLEPQNDIIVATKQAVEEKSPSGLILGAANESPPVFKVVFTNSEYGYEKGDLVIVGTSPVKAKFDGTEYFFIKVESILAVYTD